MRRRGRLGEVADQAHVCRRESVHRRRRLCVFVCPIFIGLGLGAQHDEMVEINLSKIIELLSKDPGTTRRRKLCGIRKTARGRESRRSRDEISTRTRLGYLHIGHVKAIFLNKFYADAYKGKMLVRFDDTNPDLEKSEYEEAILDDLCALGVLDKETAHSVVSYTSDHFDRIQAECVKLIQQGDAYLDDTEVDEMRRRRMERIASDHRDKSISTNLEEFKELLSGSPKGQTLVVRAKIDFASNNAALRDPVLYRSNTKTPHARTKTKYKAYPTYDLACPIVDSIEGVTHALRDSSYSDRKEQFDWIQAKLGLRKVHIRNFSRINFKQTLMSKRKLKHLVETGFVEGWDDPRFPTIKGVLRRGMRVETLKSFMLAQAGSKNQVDMEWDKFWSDNTKIVDKTAFRYMGVSVGQKVGLRVTNAPTPRRLERDEPPQGQRGRSVRTQKLCLLLPTCGWSETMFRATPTGSRKPANASPSCAGAS